MSARHVVHRRNSWLLLLIALLSFGAVALAVYLQQSLKLNPCPLCIAQRYLFILLGLCALFGAMASWMGSLRPLLAALGAVIAIGGIGVAVRHLYVAANPMTDCGRDRISEFVNSLALADLYPKVFMAFGGCGDAVPPFFGLSYPVWSLLLFATSTLALGLVLVSTLQQRR
jgi:protein dithiol:quinone oxidoreductase